MGWNNKPHPFVDAMVGLQPICQGVTLQGRLWRKLSLAGIANLVKGVGGCEPTAAQRAYAVYEHQRENLWVGGHGLSY